MENLKKNIPVVAIFLFYIKTAYKGEKNERI